MQPDRALFAGTGGLRARQGEVAADVQAVGVQRRAGVVGELRTLEVHPAADPGAEQPDRARFPGPLRGQLVGAEVAVDAEPVAAQRRPGVVGQLGAVEVEVAGHVRAEQAERAVLPRRPRLQAVGVEAVADPDAVGAQPPAAAVDDHRGAGVELALDPRPEQADRRVFGGCERGDAVEPQVTGVQPVGLERGTGLIGQHGVGEIGFAADPGADQAECPLFAGPGDLRRGQPHVAGRLEPVGVQRGPAGVGEHGVVEDDLAGDVRAEQADRAQLAVARRAQARAPQVGARQPVEVHRGPVFAGHLGVAQVHTAADPGVPQADRAELPGAGRAHTGEAQVVADPDAVAVEPGDPAAGQVQPREPGPPHADRVHDHAAGHGEAGPGLDEVQVQRPGDPGALDAHAQRVQRAAAAEQQLPQHLGPDGRVRRRHVAAPGGLDQLALGRRQLAEHGQRREIGHRTNQPGGRNAASSRSA
ncbi:hypothetical protein [Amycolatopsis sp. NPDC049159]|uniref:hypothetical protein n=1 Tax=Amycolatopsis sp. NPDC049159 TaxID=3157210 RepID=UPI0033F96266